MENKIMEMLGQVLEKVNEMDSKITSLDSKVNEMDSKITSLDSKVNEMDSKITSLDSKVNEMDSKITSLDGKVNNLESEFKLMKSSQEESYQILKSLEHNSQVNKAEHDRMHIDLAEVKGGVSNIENDLLLVERVSSKNWNEITYIKSRIK